MKPHVTWVLLTGLVVPSSVWAHAGHGVTPADSAAHYILEPLHFVPVALLVVAAGLAWAAFRERRVDR